MRLPFLHREPDPERARAPAPRAEAARGAAADFGAADVAAARARARRRLVGASVLVLIGILGFPLLFETQPRPLPMDIPIEVAQRASGTVASARMAAPAPIRTAPLAPPPADAGNEADTKLPPPPTAAPSSPPPAREPLPAPLPAAAAVQPAATASPVLPPATVASAPRAATAATTAAAASRLAGPAPQTPDGARAAALLGGASAAAPTASRFVVQVGAYTDAATLREARAKVEKLGLKTYTQVIENDARKRTRVRLGPFATHEEAEAAAARIKRAGLPANVLTL